MASVGSVVSLGAYTAPPITIPALSTASIQMIEYGGTSAQDVWLRNDASLVNARTGSVAGAETRAYKRESLQQISNAEVSAVAGDRIAGTKLLSGAGNGPLSYLNQTTGNFTDFDKVDDGAVYIKVTGVSAGHQVQEASIANLAVATGKLADTAVTEGKIAAVAVTADKVANGAVSYVHTNFSGDVFGGNVYNFNFQRYTRG